MAEQKISTFLPARWNKLINDALKPDCDDRYAALQRQVEALEEANKRLADERDFYVNQCHAYEARLAGKVYDRWTKNGTWSSPSDCRR